MLHTEDGTVIQVSNSWCEITGYSREELATIGDWTERAYGERKQAVRDDIDRLYELDHAKHEGDYVVRTKSGGTRTWEFSSAPLGRLPDGRRLVISMAMDVTERRLAEKNLSNHAAELERFYRNATGRELRMIELKQEVNELCRQTDQPPRYPLDFIEPATEAAGPQPKKPS